MDQDAPARIVGAIIFSPFDFRELICKLFFFNNTAQQLKIQQLSDPNGTERIELMSERITSSSMRIGFISERLRLNSRP